MHKLIYSLIFSFMITAFQAAHALHPAQFSDQVSAMLQEAEMHPALEVELDFMFNRHTLRTTEVKFEHTRMARKHGITMIAEEARKILFAARRHVHEVRWGVEEAIASGDPDVLEKAVEEVQSRVEEIEEMKTAFLGIIARWTAVEKNWPLMPKNEFVRFADKAFFQMVKRHIYRGKDRKDPPKVPILIDDLNSYRAELSTYMGYVKSTIEAQGENQEEL